LFFPGEDTAGAVQGETLPIPFQQRLTILLELELNIFLNNYLNRRIKVFPGEDTAGAVQGETRTIQSAASHHYGCNGILSHKIKLIY